MPIAEIYVPMFVGFDDDPKIVALLQYGKDAGLCRDLYLAMCRYCRRNLTDGFVPAYEVMRLALPLAMPDAMPLAEHLADVELTTKTDDGWIVAAYVKRNGTRADVEARSDRHRDLARRRWKNAGHSDPVALGNAIGSAIGSAPGNAKTESETIEDRAREPRGARGWTPSGVLDQPPARRGRPAHRAAADVAADARRPGGPAQDVTATAAAARQALAQRPLTDRSGQPPADDAEPAAGLHGEALARAQLAASRRRRAAAGELAAAPAAEPADAGEGSDPLGLDGGTETADPVTGEAHVEPAPPGEPPDEYPF